MPKRSDINHVLVIGSGPIQIGQAAEFDYSGTQACRVLRSEGIRVTLVNSNPATIMTDPEIADSTYVEPIDPGMIEDIIATEKPDALLPTLGGQTALNAAIELHDRGILEKYGVELIGADFEAIHRGEDRQKFKEVVAKAGGEVPRSATCHSMDEVWATIADLGLPAVIRPSFTMGGLGSGMAYTNEDVERIAGNGLAESPTTEVLIEESVLGWKEFELELMRDHKDNVVIVCSIENIDPMGVHTGDSVTVAPSMTLTDREYQEMRDIGIAVLREVGVDTGGCNIQFAINPDDGRIIVIEMNPRVSRSSALASKATGFPIAKIAAKLAIGYSLDEIPNDITKATPAAFEPALDYVVVKVPRFAFEKFPGADPTLTTTMKSVGEAMSLGRTFKQALQKALRSDETAAYGFWTTPDPKDATKESTLEALRTAHDGNLYTAERALRLGATVDEVHSACEIDPWFLHQIAELVELRAEIVAADIVDTALLRKAKRAGCCDAQIAALRPELAGEDGVRSLRHRLGLRPVYKTVDTCAAEFASRTPYHYSSYEDETEVEPSARPKVMILGSGPNRIGQGIEFDYSCVHAVQALRDIGYETIMVNCNPETVSTDYDTADRLYFEPLTFEDVTEVYHAEHQSGLTAGGPGVVGVIVQLGGQTPLALADRLQADGLPVIGTSPEAINSAEDRGEFEKLLHTENLAAPDGGVATSFTEAKEVAARIGYPVLVRPSYVLGGRGMEIVYDELSLESYIARATEASPEHPVLVDRFLDDAIEIDVDCLSDGDEFYLGGIMEHIEEAGVHSGDSSCALPPITLGATVINEIRDYTERLARGIGVRGLMNVQYALKDEQLYVLEANPRASRTVPFVSKATGYPLAKAAARIMSGSSIAQLREEGILAAEGDGTDLPPDSPISVKEVVLPFKRFRTSEGGGIDALLSPEMKSTGEVMGIDTTFGRAFAKSTLAVYGHLPSRGKVFVSVADRDKRSIVFPIQQLVALGFEVYATVGTGLVLKRHGIAFTPVTRHSEAGTDDDLDAVGLVKSGDIDLVITTPSASSGPRTDGWEIRTAAVVADVPCITTIQGAGAAVMGIEAASRGELAATSLQRLGRQ
ncbi:carbamoyl-phosphate synthase large subunit [Haloglycomyces albus]|uniref:carbamoyl-phosphate synthase large subunit n=1 Tax=Haloglycomyces albus TaxID=526067 RepID=UPI00046D8DBA|nr:carbamoyl-phosphate synthase large subunit [Haloglycomyces albus]